MFIREVPTKRKDGSVVRYLQLVESVWDAKVGYPRPKLIHSFGRLDDANRATLVALAQNILRRVDPEKAARLELPLDDDAVLAPEHKTHPFGEIYVLDSLWRELGLAVLLRRRFTCAGAREPRALERAVFAMVAHMATATGSKRACWREWLTSEVHVPGTDGLKLGRFYEAMDLLEAAHEDIELHVFRQVASVQNVETDLLFYYDTTTVYWEIEQEDEGRVWKRPPRDAAPFRMLGHSKDYRSDAPQVVIGMAVTRDGFPVRSWIFPGNTVDVTTIAQVKHDLNAARFHRPCVLVGDRGMISDENMRILTGGRGGYILGVPMRRGEKEVEAALGRAGRFQKVKDNLRVKEVWYPSREAARAQRFIVCYNPDEAERDHKQREDLLERLGAELTALHLMKPGDRTQRIHELMANKAFKRYLRELKSKRLRIDRAKVHREERLDGKYLITSPDDTLTGDDLALAYKHLQVIEKTWRTMKDSFELGPVRHYAPRRIRAHIRMAQIAVTLTRLVETRSQMTWANAQLLLKQVHSARVTPELLGTTPMHPQTAKLLEKVRVPPMPRLVPMPGIQKVERELRT